MIGSLLMLASLSLATGAEFVWMQGYGTLRRQQQRTCWHRLPVGDIVDECKARCDQGSNVRLWIVQPHGC